MSSVEIIKTTKGGADIFIVTMQDSEGPGSAVVILYTHDGFATTHCSSIAFPASLNEPEFSGGFLGSLDFNGGMQDLVLAARSESKSEGSKAADFYRYTSINRGANWSEQAPNPER